MTKHKLVKNMEGRYEWVEVKPESAFTSQKKINAQGEDLTVDGYINKYGGIVSNIDNKLYTSKGSYMDHISANNKIIKDY